MPVQYPDINTEVILPLPKNAGLSGIYRSLLYDGSKFQGYQKSKGNSCEVEVILQVIIMYYQSFMILFVTFSFNQ